jgi:hypothetical protein
MVSCYSLISTVGLVLLDWDKQKQLPQPCILISGLALWAWHACRRKDRRLVWHQGTTEGQGKKGDLSCRGPPSPPCNAALLCRSPGQPIFCLLNHTRSLSLVPKRIATAFNLRMDHLLIFSHSRRVDTLRRTSSVFDDRLSARSL